MVAIIVRWHAADTFHGRPGMPDAITGLWVAASTPIDPAGKVDHAALASHVRRLLVSAMTGEALWRNVRPPLRVADATAGARIAAMLEALERPA